MGLNVSDPVNAVGIGIYFFDPDGNKLEFFHDMYPGEKGLEGQNIMWEKAAPTIPVKLDPIF